MGGEPEDKKHKKKKDREKHEKKHTSKDGEGKKSARGSEQKFPDETAEQSAVPVSTFSSDVLISPSTQTVSPRHSQSKGATAGGVPLSVSSPNVVTNAASDGDKILHTHSDNAISTAVGSGSDLASSGTMPAYVGANRDSVQHKDSGPTIGGGHTRSMSGGTSSPRVVSISGLLIGVESKSSAVANWIEARQSALQFVLKTGVDVTWKLLSDPVPVQYKMEVVNALVSLSRNRRWDQYVLSHAFRLCAKEVMSPAPDNFFKVGVSPLNAFSVAESTPEHVAQVCLVHDAFPYLLESVMETIHTVLPAVAGSLSTISSPPSSDDIKSHSDDLLRVSKAVMLGILRSISKFPKALRISLVLGQVEAGKVLPEYKKRALCIVAFRLLFRPVIECPNRFGLLLHATPAVLKVLPIVAVVVCGVGCGHRWAEDSAWSVFNILHKEFVTDLEAFELKVLANVSLPPGIAAASGGSAGTSASGSAAGGGASGSSSSAAGGSDKGAPSESRTSGTSASSTTSSAGGASAVSASSAPPNIAMLSAGTSSSASLLNLAPGGSGGASHSLGVVGLMGAGGTALSSANQTTAASSSSSGYGGSAVVVPSLAAAWNMYLMAVANAEALRLSALGGAPGTTLSTSAGTGVSASGSGSAAGNAGSGGSAPAPLSSFADITKSESSLTSPRSVATERIRSPTSYSAMSLTSSVVSSAMALLASAAQGSSGASAASSTGPSGVAVAGGTTFSSAGSSASASFGPPPLPSRESDKSASAGGVASSMSAISSSSAVGIASGAVLDYDESTERDNRSLDVLLWVLACMLDRASNAVKEMPQFSAYAQLVYNVYPQAIVHARHQIQEELAGELRAARKRVLYKSPATTSEARKLEDDELHRVPVLPSKALIKALLRETMFMNPQLDSEVTAIRMQLNMEASSRKQLQSKLHGDSAQLGKEILRSEFGDINTMMTSFVESIEDLQSSMTSSGSATKIDEKKRNRRSLTVARGRVLSPKS